MKITVNQLRKIIKEEISRALNESNGEEILKKVQGSIFLRSKLKQMVDNPDMQQQIADMWDEALSKVHEMMVYIRANSKPGYINSKARNEAILNAASSFSDPEAANYLNAALDNKKLNLTGADLLSAAAAAEAKRSLPKPVVTSRPQYGDPNDPYRDVPYLHGRVGGPRYTGD